MPLVVDEAALIADRKMTMMDLMIDEILEATSAEAR
jgi:hypothetical protein